MIRATKPGDPERGMLIRAWMDQQEAAVAKENTPRADIVFNIDKADVYLAAGYIEVAVEYLDDALLQALQQEDIVLENEIKEKNAHIEKIYEEFEEKRKALLSELGYEIKENRGKYLALAKDGVEIFMEQYPFPSNHAFGQGKISSMQMTKENITVAWKEDMDQEAFVESVAQAHFKDIFDELITHLN